MTPNPDKIRCSKNCGRSSNKSNAARKIKLADKLPSFIGVDGEGMMIDGEHRYVLLSVGDYSLERGGAHLHISEIFDFLYWCFLQAPDKTYVGYYLGYDFTQWLRTMPEDRVRMLLNKDGISARQRKNSGGNPTPFPVYWKDWEFDTLGLRKFKLRRKGFKEWMTICDAGAFFQMSFQKASDQSQWKDKHGKPIILASEEENLIIDRGKARRSVAVLDTDMIEYNRAENRVLSRMMETLASGMKEAGIKLQRSDWYGPGRAAQAWMLQHNSHNTKALSEHVPPSMMRLARDTYFGGWFEITAHGHIPGTTYEYDINSAYPAVHSCLPCLLHGEWSHGEGKPPTRLRNNPDRYTMIKGRAVGDNRYLGAMQHRTPKGTIHRPHETYGTFWLHEWEAAIRAGLINPRKSEIDTWSSYKPCSCEPPMAGLRGLYQQRLEVGKNTPEGKALKLIYNSTYGKCAQSIGSPRFANAIHASLITAGTRTAILEAIATHPGKSEAVRMIATDGIYFSAPHDKLTLSQNIGEWDHCKRENMLLVMPGLYWDDKVRKARVVAGIKSRGVNAEALLAMIDTFDEQFDSFNSASEHWPKIDVPIKFSMVTAKQALQRGDYSLCGRVSTTDIRTISADPSNKRMVVDADKDGRPIITHPHAGGEKSVPYNGTFGEDIALRVGDIPLGDTGMNLEQEMADTMNTLREIDF